MSALLIDTSAYSAFRRGHPEIIRSIQRAGEICLSPIVLGELRAAFLRGSKRRENDHALAQFVDSPRVRILAVEDQTAERYGVIRAALYNAGTPIPTNDIWIAASAMEHGLRVVTLDAHFLQVPQVIVDLVQPPSRSE